MPIELQETGYIDNSIDENGYDDTVFIPVPTNDLFNGQVPIEQALQRLRTKLLDISSKNRLISYRYPKGKSIQFVNSPNLNLIFNRLTESKPIGISFVQDPPVGSYTQKKPDVKGIAESLGIDVDIDFPPESCTPSTHRRLSNLQALFYPQELDKICRKIASEARTVIEETGTNMLFLIFGFLEFYDSDDSEKPIYAPLLAVPVTLNRGAIDPITRTYLYSINYSGEDVHSNQTLNEKMKQDFTLNLPEYSDEEEIGEYFTAISQAVKNKNRWRVRYQLTLGFLSFGKLAIWADLDPKKCSGLLTHPLLNEIFSGGSGGVGQSAEDYEIDNHCQGELPLIYDADSSQHSAIIDVMNGKNIVINGPPGTGKSQTITNIIASGLNAGKTVLFVSEKLAALEVVRHRLNHANLGHFCLELHSHKTQKKKLLSDLQDRIDAYFVPPQQLQNRITTLNRHKKDLNRYVELISSRIGNELGLTVHEIFWKTERFRQMNGEMVNALTSLNYQKAENLTLDEIADLRAKVEVLGQLYSTVKSYDSNHPWWGFFPKPLAPGDDSAISRVINEAKALAETLYILTIEFQERVSFLQEPSLDTLLSFNRLVQELPTPPDNLRSEIFPRVFNTEDPLGKHNRGLLNGVINTVKHARELKEQAEEYIVPHCELSFETAEPILESCKKQLSKSAFSTPLRIVAESISEAENALSQFKNVISEYNYVHQPIPGSNTEKLEKLDSRLKATLPLTLEEQQENLIREGSGLLSQDLESLGQSLERVTAIARHRELKFEGTPAEIANLGRGEGIDEILSGVIIDEAVLEKAKQAAKYYLSDLPIGEMDRRQQRLHYLNEQVSRLLYEIGGYAQNLNLTFDGTQKSIEFLATISKISSTAPTDLLDYRHAPLAHPMSLELIPKAEDALQSEILQRQSLSNEFHLDALPELSTLKTTLLTFRRGDSLFNIFNSDWRAAKKLFNDLSKNKTKLKASEYEEKISNIITWLEHRTALISNEDFKRSFGPLFRGLDTDISKIKRLNNWYMESMAELLKHPGFIDNIDLSALSSQTINQVGALSARILSIASELDACLTESRDFLGDIAVQMDSVLRQSGWNEYNKKISEIADALREITSYLKNYIKPEVSPVRAVDVLNAKMELSSAVLDFEALNDGDRLIHDKYEHYIPGISKIPCNNWREYLNQLAKVSSASTYLANSIFEYADSKCDYTKVRAFLVAKLELDNTLSKFAPCPDKSETSSWKEYHSAAASLVATALELVNMLLPVGVPGKTAKEIENGLISKKKSIDTIQDIHNNKAVMGMLQDLFDGMDTDLDALSATLGWGEEISRKRSIHGTPLLPYLLSQNAVENLEYTKNQLRKIIENRQRVLTKLAELKEFGEFDVKEWNAPEDDYAHAFLKRIECASSNLDAVLTWSRYIHQRSDCHDNGLKTFVNHVENKVVPVDNIGDIFEYIVYRSIGRKIYRQYPELEGFSGEKHDKIRAEFVALDKEIINLTGKSFAHDINKSKYVPDGVSSYKVSELTDMHLLRKEINKKTKHISIRQLIRRAGDAIQALKPCFMMGPLSVAQYIQQGAISFDMIVMDEASQLRPEESLGAIARGSQLIVVGDPKQLPPTNFFDRLADDSEDDDESEAASVFAGTESILDICQQLFHPVRTLKWHYRSQHESLIAFSNHHFYNGKLIVFPSPYAKNNRLGLRYRYIKNGVYKDRQNMAEAQRVVDAAIEHMINFPEESLGIVTLNQTQRDLIEDLMDKKVRNIDEAQSFISNWEEEGWPFFVKNLENVQGDERDIIFISTTFGKPAGADKVRQNFGPISRPDGWRRLNVLFTRARRKIELFTSMLPEDIIIAAGTPAGTRALRDYLDFAKRGILTSTEVTGREEDSDFEISVGDMLRNRGYEVVPQVGVAGFFIDLAVRNPDRPGEFLAAVECDGASYHSSASARDRDRIRQCILESLGWKGRIWRVWSTDWFYNPRRESEKLLNFLEERREISKTEQIDYEMEEVFEEDDAVIIQSTSEEASDTSEPSMPVANEELYVEIGDLVTYCHVDSPDERKTAMIVETESNTQKNFINENTPLAKAMLDSTVGDTVGIVVNGGNPKVIKILKIQRQ